MVGYKKQYDIIRVGSFPTMEQHGRGRHNLELSKVYTQHTLFITWKTSEILVTEVPDLHFKKFKFYDNSVRNSNILIDRFNRVIRAVMLISFSVKSIALSLLKSPKIIHIHSPMFLVIGIALKTMRQGKTRLFITFHGEDYIHTNKSKLLKFLVKAFVDKSLFISWTQWAECDFSDFKYWTPNGIDANQWTRPEGVIRKPKSVVSVAKFKPQKNFIGLIQSWQKVIKKYPDAHLTIVGEGELENKIKYLIQSLEIDHSVSIIPFQNQEELCKIYWQNEIFISNSTWEGFAKVVLEALACNCKIAVTAVDSHKKVFKDWPYLIIPDNIDDTEQKLLSLLSADYPWFDHDRLLKKYDSENLHSIYKEIIDETL